jgi:hypothetical protein
LVGKTEALRGLSFASRKVLKEAGKAVKVVPEHAGCFRYGIEVFPRLFGKLGANSLAALTRGDECTVSFELFGCVVKDVVEAPGFPTAGADNVHIVVIDSGPACSTGRG